ncbi:MAG: hypothetical protein BWX66_01586 [Deltaproteobacteria bacterium ADurb.Bin058]|nr:MAG: hypothetical protein BWX66_01586 [Deltaproteobacteria bacterium ADurb.Bin058]
MASDIQGVRRSPAIKSGSCRRRNSKKAKTPIDAIEIAIPPTPERGKK